MILKLFFFAVLVVVKGQPVDPRYEIIEQCKLDQGLNELTQFANKQCSDRIKNKILEFVQKARDIPRNQITNEKYATAEILVRSAVAGLKVDTYTEDQKVKALDGMMEVFKMFNTEKKQN